MALASLSMSCLPDLTTRPFARSVTVRHGEASKKVSPATGYQWPSDKYERWLKKTPSLADSTEP